MIRFTCMQCGQRPRVHGENCGHCLAEEIPGALEVTVVADGPVSVCGVELAKGGSVVVTYGKDGAMAVDPDPYGAGVSYPDDLNPCPRCDGQGWWFDYSKGNAACFCLDCGYVGPASASKGDAIRGWQALRTRSNGRTAEPWGDE